MPVLYTLLGIILFIVVLFCIKLTVVLEYGEKTVVRIKYLFLDIPVFDSSKPKKEKKPKKDKKAKADKKDNAKTETVEENADGKTETSAPDGEAKTENTKQNKAQKQGNGLLKQLYLDHGYEGLEKMLRDLGKSLNGFFGKLYKTFTMDELYITMITAGNDAADTAVKHGKLCAWVYPLLGKLVSTCKVRKYDFDISPDFLATKSKGEAYAKVHIIPIKVTNAAVVLALQLVFKILFKVIFSKKKSDKSKGLSQPTSEKKKNIPTETAENENVIK